MDNLTNATDEVDYTDADTAVAAYYFIMFLLIVPTNILVILTVVKKQHRKNRMHYFILHLAIADLLVGVVDVLGDGIEASLGGVWHGGEAMCRAWQYLKIVVLIASNDLLIGLSIDRLLAIAFPMMVMKRGSKLYKAFVIGAWLMGFVLALWFPFISTINARQECSLVLGNWWKPYITIVMLGVYVLPTVIITGCYVTICIVVWRKWRESQCLHEQSHHAADGHDKHVETSNGLLSKAKVKSIKMTLVICLAFFLCWTPYFVIILTGVYGAALHKAAFTIVAGLYCLNSLCNPLVFILFNRDKFFPDKLCPGKTGEEEVCEEPVTMVSHDNND